MTFVYVIVLFFVVEGPGGYQASVLAGDHDSYEACIAALAPYPGVLPGVMKDRFAGAACVESGLASKLEVGESG